MRELEALMQQLLELVMANPDSLLRVELDKKMSNWRVAFVKGGVWWRVVADEPDEELKDVIKVALGYFDSITDEMIQAQREIANQLRNECEIG